MTNDPVEFFDGFEFFPPLNDACQYSTLFREGKAIATLQRRRVYAKGPNWTLYATDGALIAKRFLGGTYNGTAKWASRHVWALLAERHIEQGEC